MNIATVYFWPFVQTIAWCNMVASCQDFNDSAPNTINCLWGVIAGVITLAGTWIKVAVLYEQLTNSYINRRDIHSQLQGSLDH